MGCWDIFCLLCAKPPHGSFNELKDLIESINLYESISDAKKKKSYFAGYFSPIYKCYKANPDKFINSIKSMKKNTKWMKKCTFLAADGTVAHGCEEVSCNIDFQDSKSNRFIAQTYNQDYDDIDTKYGVFVHTDCWKFIKQEHGIKLQYKHLPIKPIGRVETKALLDIDYGIMEKYWAQDFDFVKMIADGNEEMGLSPLKSEVVGKYVNKIFSKLKIKLNPTRIGPIASASFYKPNTYRIGLNENIWVVKGGRWVEVPNIVEFSIEIKDIQKVIKKVIKKIVFSQDVNEEPLFVLKIEKNTINIISSEDIKNKIQKKLNKK